MNIILGDRRNFRLLTEDLYTSIIKFEGRNNRIVDMLHKDDVINQAQREELRACGSRPGIMYGSPKVHKQNNPMRPILSTTGSFNYAMSKCMVSVLKVLCSNQYTVCDSFTFAQEIKETNNNNYIMASFDVESLFTNIPVKETCDIILNKLFPTPQTLHQGYNKKIFSKMLNNCVYNNIFLFNDIPYEQLDGCPMGGCISPTLANIFLCYHDEKWLNDCPHEFKPIMYRRYVDDTFLLFKESSHIQLFHEYLNSKHTRISFTYEVENNDAISFLDVLVSKIGNSFQTSTYVKTTNTGLGMKFSSAVAWKFKINLITCLIDRAFKINSTYFNLNRELNRLRQFFAQNGFNIFTIQSHIRKRFQIEREEKLTVLSVPKLIIHSSIPFISDFHNKKFNADVQDLIQNFFPQVNLRLIFTNKNTIARMLPFKDILPSDVRSNIVYKYTCGICNSAYIGETTRHYKTRIAEHRGVSPRTGRPMATVNSNIYKHFLDSTHVVKKENFEILKNAHPFELKVAESIAIHRFRPGLNGTLYSVPLNILT